MKLLHRPALALLIAVAGCSDRGSSRTTATPLPAPAPATQSADDELRRYDDPRFSADEREAVHAATTAILDPKQPTPDFDQAFRYAVSKQDAGWLVIVWRVYGFKGGKPQFVPGGHTGVMLDSKFNVKSTLPGA